MARSHVRKMFTDARLRAAKKGWDFDIEVEDIIVPERCPILGIKLEHNVGHSKANSPSIDRINNDGGYTKDNIWVISTLANNMKSSATKKELRTFSLWVLKDFLIGWLFPLTRR